MNNLLFVALGGAIGASLRYGANLLALTWLGKGFPFATLAVNIVGSFLMGVLLSAIEHGIITDQFWRLSLSVGLFGALTTFSTFSLDTVLMLQNGEWQKALSNILLNVVVCLGATWLGLQCFSNKV